MAKSNNKNVYRGVTLYIDGKEVEGSVSKIKAEMKKLRTEIDACSVGSDEYVQKTKRYRELNTILNEHRDALRGVNREQTSALDKGVNLFNKYAASGAAVVAAITGVAMKLNSFRKQMNEIEDSKANVQALTGLDDDSVAWLEQQAMRVSTTMDETGLRVRESTQEILDAYTLVGSNKPELLEDKEALHAVTMEVMRLSAASKMQLKPAADATTTALNQYGAGAEQAARYVNVLAAGSKFGAANVEQQAAAILKAGTIAATSNIPIEELVGSIEMLAEKGIKSEIAGTGLKTFLTRLATGSEETNPKVVGLVTALENLNAEVQAAEAQSAGGGVALLKKRFGDEGMQTAMILSQNAEAVRNYAEAVTDTNIAMEQAAINSDTAKAKLAQVRNELNMQGIALVKTLNPAIVKFLNGIVNTSRYTVKFIDLLQKNRVAFLGIGTAFTLYYGWQQRKIIWDKLSVLWSDKLSVSIKNVGKAITKNPWGVALVAIGAVTGALIDYNRRMKEAETRITALDEAKKSATQTYADESSEVHTLTSKLHNNNLTIESRREALKRLKEIVPDYLADLTDEGTLINNNKSAIDQYLTSLEKKIRLQAYEEKLKELHSKKIEAVDDWSTKSADYWKIARQNTLQGYDRDGFVAKSLNLLGLSAEGNAKKLMDNARETLDNINADIARVEQEIENVANSMVSSTNEDNNNPDANGNGGGGLNTTELEKVEQEYAQKRLSLKQKYYEGEIATQAEYNLQLADLEMELLERKLEIAGLEPEKIAEIKSRLLDLQIKAKEDLIRTREEEASQELAVVKQQYADDIYEATMSHYRGETSEEEHLARLEDLRKQYYDKVNNITNLGEKEKNAIVEEQREQELQDSREAYEKLLKEQKDAEEAQIESYKEQAQTYIDLGQDLADAVGVAFNELFSEEEDAFNNFVRNILVILLEAWEKQLIATQAAAIANVTMKDISEKGFAGIASAAGKIALISTAFEAAKGILKSFDAGGYTPNGRWNEAQGIVHSNEFVANRFAVANPAVRPLLDLLDQAQRSGTIANLSEKDIAAVYGNSLTYPINMVPIPSGGDGAAVSPELLRILVRLDRTMSSAEEAYRQPSPAYCYLNGDGGVKKMQELDEKIVNNAKRKSHATTNH